jgi:hypothetical protein
MYLRLNADLVTAAVCNPEIPPLNSAGGKECEGYRFA